MSDDRSIATEVLLKSAHDTIEAFLTTIEQLRSQRDELLAALEAAIEQAENAPFTRSTAPYFYTIMTSARAAIAKAKGGS